MKKKIGIALGVIAVFMIAALVFQRIFFTNEPVVEEMEDPYGIEYFTVPSMEQVFVNGTVKPEQSQEFSKEESYGVM